MVAHVHLEVSFGCDGSLMFQNEVQMLLYGRECRRQR